MFKRLAATFASRARPRAALRLSVIVVCYKMEHQIGNTLRSLLPPYQQKIKTRDYEILLVDNGSPQPLPEAAWKLADNIRHLHIPAGDASPNPGVAINRAMGMTKGEVVSVMIDGARMLTPGVLSWGLRLTELAERALVEVRGWHLGPKAQPDSILEGYCHEVEKQMLLDANWTENGYRLFEICAASAQTREGFLGPSLESNCLFMRRALFDEIGGYNTQFSAPGGGWVNLDFFARAVAAASPVFTLLGEGTFHQVHGGAATGRPRAELAEIQVHWREESKRLRGELPRIERKKFILAGHVPKECVRWLGQNSA